MDKYFDILITEYNTLKSEQLERIKIRDTLIYISLGVFGAIFSFAMLESSKLSLDDKRIVLLLLPTISFILSWVYIDNDAKISHIGDYIKSNIIPSINKEGSNVIFGWEIYHKNDYRKNARKTLQWFTDILTFFIPAVVSIYLYFQHPSTHKYVVYFAYWNLLIIGIIFILISCYNRDICILKNSKS
jgi:H+/Cl- antiporter ClcA